MKRKAAIILNFGFYGTGYLLLGQKTLMGWILVAADIAAILFFSTILDSSGHYKIDILWLEVNYVLIGLALAADTYYLTKKNQKSK